MPRSFRPLACVFCACALAATSSLLPAQTPSGSDADDDIVELSPFVVSSSKDVGYIGTDSVAAGRLSINLMQSPTDTSILTREFLDDIMAFNLDDASLWLPSSTVNYDQADARDWGSNVTFRGLPTSGVMRNYFSFGYTPDTYVVERLEAGRGGNAVVFAESGAGGRRNFTTKRALFKNADKLAFNVDTNGSIRAAVDVNRRITRKVALRANVVGADGRKWLDNYEDKKVGAQVTLSVRPWRGGELNIEGESLYQKVSSRNYLYADTSSLWDRTTVVTAALAANPDQSSGLARITQDWTVLGGDGVGVQNYKYFARTNGTALSIISDAYTSQQDRPIRNMAVLPRRSFNNSPEANEITYRPQSFTTTFEQQLGNLFVSVGMFLATTPREGALMNTTSSYIDVNKNLPDGTPNPNFGKYYSEVQPQAAEWGTTYADFRASAAYALKWSWGRQMISITGESAQQHYDPREYRWAVTKNPTNPAINPAINNSANRVYYWRYWDDVDNKNFKLPENQDGYEFIKYLTRDSGEYRVTNTFQIATSGFYFKESLTLVAGMRFDDYKINTRTRLYDANGYPADNNNVSMRTRPKTGSIGATYFPIHSVGLYFSYNEGFQTQGGDGTWVSDRPPVRWAPSTSYSSGLRFRLLDNKIVGTVGYYRSDMQNYMVSLTGIRSAINQIWSDMGSSIVLPGTFSTINDTVDYKGSGWEADFTVNVTKQFRMIINGALPDSSQTNCLPDLNGYYAKNIESWMDAAANPDFNRVRILNNVRTIENTINNYVPGRRLNGDYEWRANIFGSYQFTGKLSGLRCGLGANFFGRRLIGNRVGYSFDYIYSDFYYTVTASAGYKMKIGKTTAEFSVNVANLLDYSKPVFGNTQTYNNVAYRGSYSYIDPLAATFSATFAF